MQNIVQNTVTFWNRNQNYVTYKKNSFFIYFISIRTELKDSHKRNHSIFATTFFSFAFASLQPRANSASKDLCIHSLNLIRAPISGWFSAPSFHLISKVQVRRKILMILHQNYPKVYYIFVTYSKLAMRVIRFEVNSIDTTMTTGCADIAWGRPIHTLPYIQYLRGNYIKSTTSFRGAGG